MKKFSFILIVLITIMFVGCDLFTKPEVPKNETNTEEQLNNEVVKPTEELKPVAEIHIPVKSDRRVYTFDDVTDFEVTLKGTDSDGFNVNELCGDYTYDTDEDEIIVPIMKSGYYYVDVLAKKQVENLYKVEVAHGTSNGFKIEVGDSKTIIVNMFYLNSYEYNTSTLYKFYNLNSEVKIYSIIYDPIILPSEVESYVNFLKETTETNWYDDWGKENENLNSLFFEAVRLVSDIEPIEFKGDFISTDFYEEGAVFYVMYKNLDSDIPLFVGYATDTGMIYGGTFDYIYYNDNDGNEVEKIAYYIGKNKFQRFYNFITIDVNNTSTDGGIQINW